MEGFTNIDSTPFACFREVELPSMFVQLDSDDRLIKILDHGRQRLRCVRRRVGQYVCLAFVCGRDLVRACMSARVCFRARVSV